MISIYKIKPKFQQLLSPVLKALHKLGITANQITFSAILLSFAISLCFWYAKDYTILFLALPVGLLIRMALNALDGMMARTYNQQSKAGEVLNELGDIVSDFAIFLPLIIHETKNLLLVVIFMGLSIINEFAGILGKAVSNDRRYDGPMGKSDRAFVISIYGLLCFFEVDLSQASFWIFLVINILLLISTGIRVKKSLAK